MELYLKVRLARSEGMSQRELARHFNISRDSVRKMLAFSSPPGYGDVPELRAWVANSPFPQATVRHAIADPAMHLHLARTGAGMTILATWVQSIFPELQRVPGTALDRSRSTWVLMHGDLRRVRRVRLFVDFLYESLLERRADFIG